ncbi:MAG: glutathione S-transferase family protein [Phenylobacterium sp.]|uniref:glutathione S-transferase family protein n=1 Tax=Phenylobacterium sp. TaxID=1871053 RepID=UPI00271D7F58|nr:glutathione S-transferase family protein [Phenylobacterium sp.]MDO8900853.1 glutathione S-transferase family protein [Phenylobacterium sp.]MDP2212917.1 glutathione S-transferase family protein [Phenylobacterium sp.]
MATLIFHSMAASAYLWTAMMAADEKGVDHELSLLTLGSETHLRLHPFGKMPVMQHGQVILYETQAITHYIDRAFDGPPLQPADPLGQAETLRWVSLINAYVFPVMNRFMKERLVRPAWGFEPDQAFLETARDPLRLQIRLIGEAVEGQGFLVGDRLTLADAFLLPHLLFFGRTPEGAALLDATPAARRWLDRMMARESYVGSAMAIAYSAFHGLAADPEPIWGPG